jgi:hypothetical protein
MQSPSKQVKASQSKVGAILTGSFFGLAVASSGKYIISIFIF